MKRPLIVLAAALVSCPIVCNAVQTAQARFYCLSIHFDRGEGGLYGWDTLDLTTLGEYGAINGELAPLFEAYTHWSWFELYDALWEKTYYGILNVNTPNFTDANGNGFDDFFEVAQPVSATSTGIWRLEGGSTHTLNATWTRAAGSSVGTCVLNLSGIGPFTHTFRLLEYTGQLAYTPHITTVTGRVDLVRTGSPDEFFGGPVVFVKNPTNRFNLLELQPGAWTNAYGQTFVYTNDIFTRELPWTTNYCGYVEFDDGDPNTPGDPDYYLWVLSIDDTNDADLDSIPDFSDDPVVAPPRRPILQLTRGTTNLLLRISGDIGRLHQILEAPSITATTWTTNMALVLTNDPQTVSLPLPPNTRFWRVRAF